ncbi:CopG family ribbon-helix-helix protein [Pseudomonas sp. NPDC088368]|uniref:CopG family ribbon-helix-helix protein n=1 Tax=Pseudomonas sp. NPDC088368 TaxID=3364453 RepID=UPI00381E9EB6
MNPIQLDPNDPEQALSASIDQEEERNRLTRKALADVDSGRVIDHQAVKAWAESLSTEAPLSAPH